MTKGKKESAALRPSHQASGEGYPGEWARRIELSLDKESRRAMLYGGLFCAFVLAVVVAGAVGVIFNTPPKI